MGDQRNNRVSGVSMSRENETRRMQAIIMFFLGIFFIIAGALSLWNGAPVDRVTMLLFGVTSILTGIRNYRRISRATE
jgi:hypothetical protein